ncbi:hypothetical protein MNBD_GAMMA09-2427 [hydrothermal vent metagenome]|uniref:ABC transporter, substrate-binding protein (Cluster 12, methionine/phosphonates) n=1 Tax=hydrothermal vent metagenome TaxID=652676 RepID=A0A3B0XV98_9ZZZZ
MNKTIVLLLLCLVWLPTLIAAERVYTWTVVPQFNPTVVHRDWGPLMKLLEQRTGYRFKLIIADSFTFYETSLFKGKIDFAYANPYQTLLAHREQGYIPLIRDGQRRLTGILVVRNDSPLQNVKDVEGKRIVFASPNAFAVSLYLRALMTEKEGVSYIADYVGTHSNAYRQVLLGRAAASGGVYRTLHKERAEVQNNLRVIYESPSTITHAIVAHPDVPAEVRESVQKTILSLTESEEGKVMLRHIFLPQPVAADFKRDYKPLKSLKLDSYVVLPE